MHHRETNWGVWTTQAFGDARLVLQLYTNDGAPSGGIAQSTEAEVDLLIAKLKEAKAAAWPKPLKPLCPASKELLSYLTQHRNITPIKAREELGIEHLPRRIKDLKEHGHRIRTIRKRGYAGKLYARYELEQQGVVH